MRSIVSCITLLLSTITIIDGATFITSSKQNCINTTKRLSQDGYNIIFQSVSIDKHLDRRHNIAANPVALETKQYSDDEGASASTSRRTLFQELANTAAYAILPFVSSLPSHANDSPVDAEKDKLAALSRDHKTISGPTITSTMPLPTTTTIDTNSSPFSGLVMPGNGNDNMMGSPAPMALPTLDDAVKDSERRRRVDPLSHG